MKVTIYATRLGLETQVPQTYARPTQTQPIVNSDSNDAGLFEPEVEPADGRAAAWRLRVVAFVVEALFWGNVPLMNSSIQVIPMYANVVLNL